MVHLKTTSVKRSILEARRRARVRLAKGANADEFVVIGEVDGSQIYVTAGKTVEDPGRGFHANPRDVFMYILEGKVEFEFEDGSREIVKPGTSLVLPKGLKHRCIFKELTIALESVYEKGL